MAKLKLKGERLATGAGDVLPLPVRLRMCGLPAALSVITSVPVRAPEAVGVKVTLIVQSAPTATEAPQLLV